MDCKKTQPPFTGPVNYSEDVQLLQISSVNDQAQVAPQNVSNLHTRTPDLIQPSFTTSHEPARVVQQDVSSQVATAGTQPTGGAIHIPSFQSKPTNVPSHKPDLLQSYLLDLLTDGQASSTSRSCLSKALSAQAGMANRQNMPHVPSNWNREKMNIVASIQHMPLSHLTKPYGTYMNNQQFSTSANEKHLFQSLQQTGNVPVTVPADLRPMEMVANSQQGVSVQNIINQSSFVNASVFGADVISANSNLQLRSQTQPFVHSNAPEAQALRTAESNSPLQIPQNRSMSLTHQPGVQNYQPQQQRPAHIQRQHQIQDLMKQTVPADVLTQLRQPVQVGRLQNAQQPVQIQQQSLLHQPRLPFQPMQCHPPTQPLWPGQFQQAQQNESFMGHQFQPQHHPGSVQQPGKFQQLMRLQTPVGQAQTLQMMIPSMNNASGLSAPLTMYTPHQSAFPSVNPGNMDATFNESLNHSNGMLCFTNDEDFVSSYQSDGIMENQRLNIQQVNVTNTNVGMRSGVLTPTSNTVFSTGVQMDGFQIPKDEPINSAAYLSGSENNLVTEQALAKIRSEIIKSQQNTLNLQRSYESQKRVLYPTNCLDGEYSLNSKQLASHITTNPQNVSDTSQSNLPKNIPHMVSDQSSEKLQSVQRIFEELALFASQYDSQAASSWSEQNIDLAGGSEPANTSTSLTPSHEQANISLTPVGYNQIANQNASTSQQSTWATNLQHTSRVGEPIAVSNEQISNGTRPTPLLTRTSHVNNSLHLPNTDEATNYPNPTNCFQNYPIGQTDATAMDSLISTQSVEDKREVLYPCIPMQNIPTPKLHRTMAQHCSTTANGTNYLNPPSFALNASMCKNVANVTDPPISNPSADYKSEAVFYPCLAKQTFSTSSADGTKKQHSGINADQMFCDASSVDVLNKGSQGVQIAESSRSVISGGEVERPAVTVARYTNDIVSFNLIKAVEPQIAIVNPLRVLKAKSPGMDQNTVLSKTDSSQGNGFVVENADKGIGDAARANNDERGIEIVSSLSNRTHVGALGQHAPTVCIESSKIGGTTSDNSCRDVNKGIINQSLRFAEEMKLTINEVNCDSTDHKNSHQLSAPQGQDLQVGDASEIALDDSNLLISSFCTLVEGNAFYDPQIAEIMDAIPTVQSMADKESNARNDMVQAVGEVELATVNNTSKRETALTDLKYSKPGSRSDQDPSNSNELGIDVNLDHANASLSKPNFGDFPTIRETDTSVKQMVLDISNKDNESAGLENNVNKNSNFPNVVTDNSTVCEINRPEGHVTCMFDGVNVDSHVEKLYYENPSLTRRDTEDSADMAGDQGNMIYSSSNPSPNTEVENHGHKTSYYNMDTAFETDQAHEDCESIKGMPSAPRPNDQLSDLLREFPYGLDSTGRKVPFEKRHATLDKDMRLFEPSTVSPPGHLESDCQFPLNDLNNSEFSNDQMLLQVEGEGAENFLCDEWQTIKQGLHYGKSATEIFCISSNIGDTENDNLTNKTQRMTMHTEQKDGLISDILPLSSAEANMEWNQNPNLFRSESSKAKMLSIPSLENECVPSEGMETEYPTSDNPGPYFPDCLASVFADGQQALFPPVLDNSITGPSIDEHPDCEMPIGTSVEGSPENNTIEMKKAILSMPEDNDMKPGNIVAQVNGAKRMKLDCKQSPLNTEQKLMERKRFKQVVKSKYVKNSVQSKRMPCEISNSVPGNTKLTIKFKDTKFKADNRNEGSSVKRGRMPESDRDIPPAETYKDPENVGEFAGKAQSIPRLVVKMDFLKSSKSFGGIRKSKSKKHGGRAPGANRPKTNKKKIKTFTLNARTNKGTFPSNNLRAMGEKRLCNSESTCKVPALNVALEKHAVPSEKVFNGGHICLRNECDSVPALKPNFSEFHCSKYHKANFEQYKKRIQTIQEYRQHQKEQAKELEEMREDDVSEPKKTHPTVGRVQIQENESSNKTNGICFGHNMQNARNSSKSVTQACKDTTIMKDNVLESKTPHQPEGKTPIQSHEANKSINNSDVICLGGNMHTRNNCSKSVAQPDQDEIMVEDVEQASQPKDKTKTRESSINSHAICLEENMNLNSSNPASKLGSNMGIVSEDTVNCQKDSLSVVVSTQPSTHYLNRAVFTNKTCETICLMILGPSPRKSSTEISSSLDTETYRANETQLVSDVKTLGDGNGRFNSFLEMPLTK